MPHGLREGFFAEGLGAGAFEVAASEAPFFLLISEKDSRSPGKGLSFPGAGYPYLDMLPRAVVVSNHVISFAPSGHKPIF